MLRLCCASFWICSSTSVCAVCCERARCWSQLSPLQVPSIPFLQLFLKPFNNNDKNNNSKPLSLGGFAAPAKQTSEAPKTPPPRSRQAREGSLKTAFGFQEQPDANTDFPGAAGTLPCLLRSLQSLQSLPPRWRSLPVAPAVEESKAAWATEALITESRAEAVWIQVLAELEHQRAALDDAVSMALEKASDALREVAAEILEGHVLEHRASIKASADALMEDFSAQLGELRKAVEVSGPPPTTTKSCVSDVRCFPGTECDRLGQLEERLNELAANLDVMVADRSREVASTLLPEKGLRESYELPEIPEASRKSPDRTRRRGSLFAVFACIRPNVRP
ncbi:unnamed protein product [Polarella glacialis]|uniref:Uncharacterized protein n=1 Tax=Polarella glacialis TaxID=89957 RepID=A0A813J6T3_POLGL|nr:unnamed protein product [Polarella glacialis]